jgi:uncharacterized protein YukE
MVKVKKYKQAKVKITSEFNKLSKEMKGHIEEMFKTSQKKTDKRLTAIEKHLEQLKGVKSKQKSKNEEQPHKPVKSKKGRRHHKKSKAIQQNDEGE